MELTQERLKEILIYNPDTGKFKWNINKGRRICKGESAGSLDINSGYISIMIDRKKYSAHRLAFLYMTGVMPLNTIDHINKIKDDNRWINLRDVTHRENMQNLSSNSTGVVGVHWATRERRYVSSIFINGKLKTVGYFYTLDGAKTARKKAELELL